MSIEGNVNEVKNTLNSLQQNYSPELFNNLILQLRQLNVTQLESIPLDHFMLDALPLLETDSAVEFMVDLIDTRRVQLEVREKWFRTIALYSKPTEKMIRLLADYANDYR